MPPELMVVDQFKGMRRGLRTALARSERRELDEPRDLRNAIIDEFGSLWIPSAPEEFHTFSDDTDRINLIANITNPETAILYQVGTELYYWRTDGSNDTMTSIVDVATEDPLWVVEFGGTLYFGTVDDTWKVEDDSWSATKLDNSEVHPGFHSYMYKGRRFVVERSNTIWFSELNEPEEFGEESFFVVGGEQTGGSWSVDPGSVVCMSEYDDYLAIFCTQSIYLFSGTTEDTFQLRRSNSLVGAWARDSVVRVESGILFFGGTPRGELGVYIFTGGGSELVSEGLTAFFRRWGQVGQLDGESIFEQATKYVHAVRWNDNYILAGDALRTPDLAGDDSREVFAYNFKTGAWTTFDGWRPGPRIGLARNNPDNDALHITKGLTVYSTRDAFARAPGERARAVLGWSDHGHPAGHHRFIAVKLSGWKIGETDPVTVTLKARTRSDEDSVEITRDLKDNIFENVVFPINLRGNGIELEFTFDFAESDDNAEALIEQVQLIRSTKGEKVSRD